MTPEEERIVRGIIGLIDHNQHYGVSNAEMLAWLKKQLPTPELTEFEKKVQSVVSLYSEKQMGDDAARQVSAELLAIARKELLKDFDKKFIDAMQEGYIKGKADTLKDIPRWRKWHNGACGNGDGVPIAIVKTPYGIKLTSCLGIEGEEYILLSDLEKLRKDE